MKLDKKNVLVIPDLHAPWIREQSLEHCKNVQKEYGCGTVVQIGDVIDSNYSSYHETDPDGLSAGDELQIAIKSLKPWYKAFPNVKVTSGNHDLIVNRKAFTAGLSKRWIKDLNQVLEVYNWEFDLEHEIDNVLYTHGTGSRGKDAAFNKAIQRRQSVVSGHLHSEASIRWNVSKFDIIFGMQVGCLVDEKSYSFDYAKNFSRKWIMSCGVVLNNGTLPIILPMKL